MHLNKEYQNYDDILDFMTEQFCENETHSSKIPNVKYCIFQIEVCPTTNNLHLQIYVEMKQSYRRSKIIKLFTFEGFKHPHCEPRHSSRDACRRYCKKAESRLEGTNYREYGTWRPDSPTAKKSTGFATIAELIEQGRNSMWIAYNRPELYLRHGDRIDKCLHLREMYERLQNRNFGEEE